MSEQSIENSVSGKIGCFGKIRAKGDFVSRNLDYEVQEYLDGWLQSAFKISQQQIESDWLKYYLTSPIWRFIISEKKMNKDIIGFMMPSIDKVGRYYPLFMLEVFDNGNLCGDELNCKSFEALEELAMKTLDDGNDSHSFFESLNASGFPLFEERSPVSELLERIKFTDDDIEESASQYLWKNKTDYTSFEFQPDSCSEDLLDDDKNFRGIWWTEGSETISKSLIYCDGLPPAEGFSALLDGNWNHWGWEEKIIKEEEEAFAAE